MKYSFNTNTKYKKTKPSYDSNTLGLRLQFDKVETVQYGKLARIENIDRIKVGDIIGVALKRVVIAGKKYIVFELCLNGIKIGHPLLSDTLIQSAYPTIWMGAADEWYRWMGDGCSIITNLGSKPFQYDNILGTI